MTPDQRRRTAYWRYQRRKYMKTARQASKIPGQYPKSSIAHLVHVARGYNKQIVRRLKDPNYTFLR